MSEEEWDEVLEDVRDTHDGEDMLTFNAECINETTGKVVRRISFPIKAKDMTTEEVKRRVFDALNRMGDA